MPMHINSVVKLHFIPGNEMGSESQMGKEMSAYGQTLFVRQPYLIQGFPQTKRITTIDHKIKKIAICGRDRLASLARSKLATILHEEVLLMDLLKDLESDRGFTTPFLQSQWEEQKTRTLQLSEQTYNDQAGMKKFTRLLKAEWSAQAHLEALDAVKKELDRISLA
ncbi:uncharacterized protein EI90DRAFT_3133220 [Cantharellus anzutake]|uniref:uncharacterized protein n=1 Tax=Cantharellus anzutake TaxID=1750568 RepID=UPI001908ECB3|nr:uncharacterized protein EI90DRAFT_3133220 [Cantharellus anzutake]KAF8318339.1 hypothetical protein EI90DRAFT_3133220 [Cantharellus anzutake]